MTEESQNVDKLIHEPNYTIIPNIIFDYWMQKLSPGEFKVLLCICRKTFGWHKTEDKISLRQIEKLTGLAKSGIVKMVSHLVDLKIVKKITSFTEHGDNAPNVFSIEVHSVYDPLLNSGGGSIHSRQGVVHSVDRGVVHSVDTQKKLYTKKNISSLIDDTCEDESCFSAVDASLSTEKKIQSAKPKEKDREVVTEDVQLKPEKKISLQGPIYKKEYTVPVKETQKVHENFFCYVDEKFPKETIDAVQSFIKSSLDMKKDKDAITAAVEKFNATNVGAVQHVRGWLTKIINSTEPVFVQIKTDEPRIKTRIQIAKCLESMSTCGGSYAYDEKKLYHTTGTLTKEYTFTGNDYFWDEKERFVRQEANKKTTSKAI